MGERKGTNKYYPPDFDPAKHGSLNRYHHSHPLRERARKLAQGILIIRFEMPYNVWCEGCKNHIGMGVRYNAEKRKVGTYYTTPIYRFRMKCHLCVNHIELQTDPATCQYLIVSGARRKEERWDMGDNQQVLPTAPEQQERLLGDPMFRLEHGVMDRGVLARATPSLVALQRAQGAWRDDFGLNSRLRQRFREEKQSLREEEEEAARLKAKGGLSIPLLREEEEDRRLAALLSLRTPHSYEEKQRLKRSEISARPWFSPPQQQQQHKPGGGGSTPRPTGGRGWQGKTPHPPVPSSTPPASAPPTPARWGIVRRRSGEEPGRGGAERRGETPTPQPPPREEEGGGDPLPAQPPPLPSLVADYSDSGSDSP